MSLRPIYGINKSADVNILCPPVSKETTENIAYMTRLTNILNQLAQTKEKAVSLERLNILKQEIVLNLQQKGYSPVL